MRLEGVEPPRAKAQRCLRPQRLPFRHFRGDANMNTGKEETGLSARSGAEDEIRTRDLLLGKEMLYH